MPERANRSTEPFFSFLFVHLSVSYRFFTILQNERPPLPASCQPALAHLIKRCWAANPSKRPDFTDIVSALEKYDECIKEGLPLTLHSGLVSRNAILERLKGCVSMSSSVIIHVWLFLTKQIIVSCIWSSKPFGSPIGLVNYNLYIC